MVPSTDTSMPDEQTTEAAKAELATYREQVVAAMEAGANPAAPAPRDVIFNRSAEHAAVIVEHLFRAAKEHVLILSSRLDTQVYGVLGVIEAGTQFLRDNPRARIDLLIETDVDATTHRWLRAVMDVDRTRVTITKMPPALTARYKYNFAVADGKHYRLEQDRAKFEAFAQFGNRKIGHQLTTTFESLKRAA